MNENKSALVERIIKDLNNVLMRPGLTDFDIVPVESNKNKSPVLYEDTSVGLESWCVKMVYMHCYNELMENYLSHPKRRLSKPSNVNQKRLSDLLNTTLLLNPDITTLWNKRREMMEKNFLEWVSELQFARLVISRKPKCNEAFMYRRWILEDVLREEVMHPYQFIDALVEEEISICTMAADKCPNNYHCWDHRRWLLVLLWSIRFDFDSTLLFYNEYKFIKDWTANHVSDHSCYHYRQFVLKKLYHFDERWNEFEQLMNVDLRKNLANFINAHVESDPSAKLCKIIKHCLEDYEIVVALLGHCPGNCKCYSPYSVTYKKLELLLYELVQSDDLLKYYKYHETLWYHRRFIVSELLLTIYNHLHIERNNGKLERVRGPTKVGECHGRCRKCHDEDLREHLGKTEKYGVEWIYHSPLNKIFVKHEKEFIKDRRKDSDKYADRHDSYMKAKATFRTKRERAIITTLAECGLQINEY
ncbi:protein prenyltransferase alpha subunit repeat-containing protein 1 isoform X1 [Trichoplusia ni]|uniref:Protein prenyltransferase alpha subunit repeat-containing protein 1 isoform X1 n=1 Tax=Trichoplusia ni TaxID=7111 RepID=A0A7E5WM28_TRINI|nr:protein prenyltransferase alpha subunit repeat-containing protein 1 isoform X1 [Trichoplusia ni]